MAIRSGIGDVVGKTITGVLVSKNRGVPETQVFLVFSDGTHIELWGSINASGVDRRGGMEAAERYASQLAGTRTRYA